MLLGVDAERIRGVFVWECVCDFLLSFSAAVWGPLQHGAPV